MERSSGTVDGALGRLRVLVLEDSPSDAELAIRELRSFGYSAQWIRIDTEESFRQHIGSDLDLILADYTLPEFDALRALEILRNQGFSTPFIIVTGTLTEETAVSVLKRGADDYLLKDRLTRLGPAVKTALLQQQLREERKRAQQSLIESERRYRRLVTRMSAILVELTPDGITLFVNEAMTAVTGYALEEVLGRNAFDIFLPGATRRQLDAAFAAFVRGEDVSSYVTFCRAKDGSQIALEWSTANEYRADSSLQKIIAFGLDVTQREVARRRLQESEARLRAAQRIGRIGDWEHNLASGKVTWSDEMFRLFERDPELGVPSSEEILAAYAPESAQATRYSTRRVCDTGERTELEQHIRLPSGRTAYHHCVMLAGRDDEGHIIKLYGTVQDVTERKKMEEERVENARRLEELSRRLMLVQEEERRRLASELHDRTSPNLAAIKLNLEMIGTKLSSQIPEEIDGRIADTRALLEDTNASIREVCADLRPSALDYAGLLPALKNYAQQFASRTGVAVQVLGPESPIRFAPELESLLFRIVQEALTNAAKHARARNISIELAIDEQHTALTIADDGVGFEADALGQPGKAPGLGLLTMRERAEFAGGKFIIDSKPGKGTRIRVELHGSRAPSPPTSSGEV
jgi:PAS domain S-box-containing protein